MTSVLSLCNKTCTDSLSVDDIVQDRGILAVGDDHVDAALGCEIKVETVDGEVTMKVPAGTQSGTPFKLSGHGVPMRQDGDRGPHIVTVIVDTPTKLSKKQKEILEEFRGTSKKRGFWG